MEIELEKPTKIMINTNMTNYDEEDRLSNLPVHILGIILSLLPIKSAIATSILSHRWQYIWTHNLPSLKLTSDSQPTSNKQVSDFWINFRHTISKLAFPLSNRFILLLHKNYYYNEGRPSFTDEWLRQICGSHIRNIQVKTHGNTMPRAAYSFVAPATFVFQMKWLVVLKLGGATFAWNLPRETQAINLPKLRRLKIHIVSSQFILLGKLISSIPSLIFVEFFVQDDGAQSHDIIPASEECDYMLLKSPYLRRLSAHVFCSGISSKKFVNAPNLWSLSLYVASSTPEVCYVGKPGLRYLKTLVLQGHEQHHNFQTLLFPTLNYLEIGSLSSKGVEPLLDLLKNTPVLRCLALRLGDNAAQWSPPEHIPKCLLTKVKRIMLSGWSFEHSNPVNFAVNFAKYLLSSARVLGTLAIYTKYVRTENVKECQHDVLQFFKEMFECQTRLLECQIKFWGANMNVSCKGTNLIEELSKGESLHQANN